MKKKEEKYIIWISFFLIILIVLGLYENIVENSKIFTSNAESIWIQKSNNDFENGTLNNLILVQNDENTVLKLNNHNGWIKKEVSLRPSPREFYGLATIFNDDKVVLFGGYYLNFNPVYFEYYNDTWVYDLSENIWTKKNPQNSPSKRAWFKMTSIYGTDKILLFGGSYHDNSNNEYYYNDTWIFDLSENKWTRQFPANQPSNRSRYGIASIYKTDKIILFGGELENRFNYTNDTWIYDLGGNKWSELILKTKPTARSDHTMVNIFGTNKCLLFGGENKYNSFNDTWIYDYNINKWIKKNTQISPSPRHAFAMSSFFGTDEIMLYGGYNWSGEQNFFNDTWIYNSSENKWVKKIKFNNPEAKQNLRISSIFETKKALLFGGYNHEELKFYDDTWIFSLSEEGDFISQKYNLGPNINLKSINWDAYLPVNTSIKFQIRTADTEKNLSTKDFLGPYGTKNTFYTTSPSNIWGGHNGDNWIQYKAYFYSENYFEGPSLNEVQISSNHLPETILQNPINNTITNNNRPVFKWNFNDADSSSQQAFQILICNTSKFDDIIFDSNEQILSSNQWQYPLSSLSDGTWYWKVRTKDNDRDWGPYSSIWKFTIDTKQPKSFIDFPINNSYVKKINSVIGKANDLESSTGLNRIEIRIIRVIDNYNWNGKDWTSNETWLKIPGTKSWDYDTINIKWTTGLKYNIRSRAIDNANNTEIPMKGIFIIYDEEEIYYTHNYSNSTIETRQNNLEIKLTILDNISGVNASSIEYSVSTDYESSWSSWVTIPYLINNNSIHLKLNLTFPNGTGNRIKWRAYDIAGNGPTESKPININVNTWQQPIKAPKIKLINPQNNSIVKSKSVELRWELLNSNLSDIKYDIFLYEQYPSNKIQTRDYSENKLLINNLENGKTYYWKISLKDDNFNKTESEIWSFSIEIDNTSSKNNTDSNSLGLIIWIFLILIIFVIIVITLFLLSKKRKKRSEEITDIKIESTNQSKQIEQNLTQQTHISLEKPDTQNEK